MPTFLLVCYFVIQISAAFQIGSPRCSSDTSCRNRCTKDTGWDAKIKTTPHCHCDQLCSLHGDCCPDYHELCADTNQAANQLANHNLHHRAECVKTNTQSNHLGIYMITSCASDWNDTQESNEQEKCLASTKANRTYTSTNISEDIPVFQLGLARNTYRNVHCAMCNGVHRFMLLYWNLLIECAIKPSEDFSDQEKMDFMLKYCPGRIVEPVDEFYFRYCYPSLNLISECSIGEDSIYRNSCLHDPTAIVHDKDTSKSYKNYGCFLCNDLEHLQCGPAPSQNFFKPKSFEVVMKFMSPTITRQTLTVTCKTGEVYDPQLEECREGQIAGVSTAMRDKYRVNAWLTATNEGEALAQAQFRDALSKYFTIDKEQVDDISITKEGRVTSCKFNLYAGRTQQQLYNRSASDIKALLQFNSSFQLSVATRTWTVFKVTSRQLACSEGDVYGPKEFNISVADLRVFIYNTSESLPAKGYHLITNESTPLNHASVFVCRSSFTVWCPKVLLPIEKEEYTILPNKSLLHNITGEVIPLGEYDLEKTKAWICTDYTMDFNTSTNSTNSKTTVTKLRESVVLRYMTIVGMSLSVLCLFLVLLTHCILPELRKPLPGKNLMSLCLSLFLADFLWLFGSGDTDKKTFCEITAIALHYLFLVSFACTVILAFDTWRTFSSKMSTMKGASFSGACGTRFFVYTGLAWGFPLLWVATSVGLDYFHIMAVGYGGPNVCWITNTDAILIVFAAPVGCALMFNVAAFSQTVWAISRAKQLATKLNTSRQDNSGALKIYVRLVTIMGFSWFFSFSAELIHSSLMYPFVICSTSQGMYIFMAFICKARVLKMFKQKLRSSAKSKHRATQQTITSFAPYQHSDNTTM